MCNVFVRSGAMKNLCFRLILMILILATPAKSAEVGDIYYHDKTFSNKVDPDKVPIGVVFWVSPDNNFGLIVSVEQINDTLNLTEAKAYCGNFSTLGTKPGDWSLPRIDDLLKLSNSYSTELNGMSNNFTKINNILKNIPTASQLKSANYIAYGSDETIYSSGYDRSYAFYVNLATGAINGTGLTISAQKYEVRCITGF